MPFTTAFPLDGESVGRARSVEFCEQAPGCGLVIVAVDRNGTDAIAGGDGTRVGEGAVYGDVAVVEGVQGVLGIAAQGRALPYVHIQHLGPPLKDSAPPPTDILMLCLPSMLPS